MSPKDSPAASDLADPATCGEDLAHNIRRVVDYAPAHCSACLDYHMVHPILRGIGRVGVANSNRAELIEVVGALIRERAAAQDGPIDIVIGGTADTQIPAACTHAALVHGGSAFPRVRFTVLDRCDTPLALCRDFAVRHGIVFDTRAVDLVTTEDAFAADILINHSLFNYVPSELHVATLKKTAAWLKPGGRLLFYMGIRSTGLCAGIRDRNAQGHALIRAALDSGALKIAEPRDVFEARLKSPKGRISEFASTAVVYDLFERCNLTLVGGERFVSPLAMPGGAMLERERVLAVLASGGR
jgi:hypothetical protein